MLNILDNTQHLQLVALMISFCRVNYVYNCSSDSMNVAFTLCGHISYCLKLSRRTLLKFSTVESDHKVARELLVLLKWIWSQSIIIFPALD